MTTPNEVLQQALDALPLAAFPFRHAPMLYKSDVLAAIAQPVHSAVPQEPVLQDIEQYRLQMAGICYAALGYWEEDDGIHPDYDTLAFRDVAKLYAKYDALYNSQPVSHAICAVAIKLKEKNK